MFQCPFIEFNAVFTNKFAIISNAISLIIYKGHPYMALTYTVRASIQCL